MSYYERTEHNPLLALGAIATGRRYITPCCTASVDEYRLPNGELWTIGSVAGHGFSEPGRGSLAETINDTGTIVEPNGKERRVLWNPALELHNEHVYAWKEQR